MVSECNSRARTFEFESRGLLTDNANSALTSKFVWAKRAHGSPPPPVVVVELGMRLRHFDLRCTTIATATLPSTTLASTALASTAALASARLPTATLGLGRTNARAGCGALISPAAGCRGAVLRCCGVAGRVRLRPRLRRHRLRLNRLGKGCGGVRTPRKIRHRRATRRCAASIWRDHGGQVFGGSMR
jgi:hypothetical protein